MNGSAFPAHNMPPAKGRSDDQGDWEVWVESWVRLVQVPESPVLTAPEAAIALAVSSARIEEDPESLDTALHLTVVITVRLPGQVAYAYRRIGKAIVITVHDACGAQLGYCTLLDPNKSFPAAKGDNYGGPSELTNTGMTVTGYYSVDIGFPVQVPSAHEGGPSVFLVASVNRLRSEAVQISLGGGTPTIDPEVVVTPLDVDDDDDDDDAEDAAYEIEGAAS